MRRVICMMLLTAVSSSAMAGWIFAKGNSHTLFFYDPASILENGKTKKIWILEDYKKAENRTQGKSICR